MLFDDEMSSMRYAANLARGYGLVFNRHSPPVQGFSNPLWVFIMAILHLLPVSYAKMSLLIQILCAMLRLATLLIVWRLALVLSRDSKMVALCAVFFTAFYYPLNNWSLRGSEVALLAPMLTLAVYLAIEIIRGAPPRLLWVLLAAATLVRLDMTIPAVTILAFVAWCDAPRRREHLVHRGGILLLLIALQLLAAWWYFGDPLPNTYYLKMTGYPTWPRIVHGLLTTSVFIRHLEPITLALIAIVLLLKRDVTGALLAAVFIAQVAYNIYVGGDAWEQFGGANRYLCIVMPLFMILLAMALHTTADGLASVVRATTPQLSSRWSSAAAFCVLALASAWTLATFGPYGISATNALRQLALMDPPLEHNFHVDRLKLALQASQITDPEATIAVTWTGIVPYFADRSAIDLLGKNDAHIAHEPMHIDPSVDFYPGHLKWDTDYSIGELKPDAIMEQWKLAGQGRSSTRGYYHKYVGGHRWYFRADSKHIRGDALNALGDRYR